MTTLLLRIKMPISWHHELSPLLHHLTWKASTPGVKKNMCSLNPRSACSMNDPSAGSPTETLLRLLLPLNDPVRSTSQTNWTGYPFQYADPKASLSRSIGSSDGRCVQRAGT